MALLNNKVCRQTIVTGLGMIRDAMSGPVPKHFFSIESWHNALADLDDDQVQEGFIRLLNVMNGHTIPKPIEVRIRTGAYK